MAVISGGTTLIDNGILDAAVPTGSLTLLSTQTASASATIDFTSGIDSTYDSYVFKLINIHAATDGAHLQFQGSTDGGSSYGVTATSTFFEVAHNEADSATALTYNGTYDLAQSTAYQSIFYSTSFDNDHAGVGVVQLFNPSSTTFVKHWICRGQHTSTPDYSSEAYNAGYFNTTSAVNAIRFQYSTGNIDSGVIKLYGIK